MNIEEELSFIDWYTSANETPTCSNINVASYNPTYNPTIPYEYQPPQTRTIYYMNSVFERKINREIDTKIEKLGNMLEIVNNKKNIQFIKGQILALQELKYSIENNYWEYERNDTMRYPQEY